MPARQPAGRRRYSGRILLHRERSLDFSHDLLGRVTYIDHDRFFWLFQICQLAGQNRLSGEVSMAGTQAVGDQGRASLQVDKPYLRTQQKFCPIGAL